MRLPQAILFLLAFVTTIHALALPASLESFAESSKELFKRKGGGGGGGRGGGGGGGRSSGGNRGSGGNSGGNSGGSRGNSGGSTRSGSGTPRAYGGGAYYGGGAAVPFRAGNPSRGVSPVLLGVGAGSLLLFPALAYGAYAYSYPGSYRYYNETSRTNETHPMECYCGRFHACGCEPNNNTDYLNSVANNQSAAKLVNNTLMVDGSLDNETTAAGGEGAASSLQQGLFEMSGFWVVFAGVAYTVWFM